MTPTQLDELERLASSDERYYRKPWMSDEQWQCALFWAEIMRGFHHVRGEFKPMGQGICVSEPPSWFSTYDFNNMTRIVFLAHDRMVRVELGSSGPGLIKFILHKRKKREGQMHERHPSIEDALSDWRKINPLTAINAYKKEAE